MNQHIELALAVNEWGLPPTARLVALILLIVFAVLTVALVPLEYRFFCRVNRRALPWMLGLELLVVVAIAYGLVGLVLDWFKGISGLIQASALLVGLWLVVIIYMVLRIILTYRTYFEYREDARMWRKARERLLEAMREDKRGDATERGDDKDTEPKTSSPKDVQPGGESSDEERGKR